MWQRAFVGSACSAIVLAGIALAQSDFESGLRHWRMVLEGSSPETVAGRIQMLVETDGILLTFWAGSGEKGKEFSVNDAHPCGATVSGFWTRIPQPEWQDIADPDLVLEIGADGSELQKWYVPTDVEVVGLIGNEVLVRKSYRLSDTRLISAVLAIGLKGSLRVLPAAPGGGENFDCPEIPQFAPSSYLRCRRLVDPSNGETRLLAYQGPCT